MALPRVPLVLLALLAGCGARELPVQTQAPASLPSAPPLADAPAPAASATPIRDDDDGLEAALAHRSEGYSSERAALAAWVKAHPTSPHLPDAYVALGDLEFDEATRDPSRLASAKPFYEAALSPAGNRVFGYAAYKLAHVYWVLSDFDRALDAFKKAIDFGASHPDVQGATTIRDSALRDIVPVFAVRGAPTKAYSFFRVLGGDDAHALRMLESLGRNYDDTGKFGDAKTIYAELKQRDPRHRCRWDVLEQHASPTANRATLNADLASCPP